MHLARTTAYPQGSTAHRYCFIAPLDGQDRIDAAAYRENRERCTVDRFWGREPTRSGWLVHRPGGVHGSTWCFDYDTSTRAEDEAGFRLGDHAFRPGEYVSIRDADGDLLTFKVDEVGPA
jgi:hypothetical protein